MTGIEIFVCFSFYKFTNFSVLLLIMHPALPCVTSTAQCLSSRVFVRACVCVCNEGEGLRMREGDVRPCEHLIQPSSTSSGRLVAMPHRRRVLHLM